MQKKKYISQFMFLGYIPSSTSLNFTHAVRAEIVYPHRMFVHPRPATTPSLPLSLAFDL
jgi:hypothetical protein